MPTKSRVPHKALWSLDEAIEEHDPDIAELIGHLLDQLQREEEAARNRYDKTARLRLSETFATVARLQQHTTRLASLHRQARANEYDQHERKQP